MAYEELGVGQHAGLGPYLFGASLKAELEFVERFHPRPELVNLLRRQFARGRAEAGSPERPTSLLKPLIGGRQVAKNRKTEGLALLPPVLRLNWQHVHERRQDRAADHDHATL